MARFCRYCGNEISETASFCTGCGKPVPGKAVPKTEKTQPQFCRKCGKELRPGVIFCRSCGWEVGTSLPGQNRPEQTSVRSTENKIKKGRGKTKTVRGIVAAVLVFALLFTSFVKPGFLRKKPGGNGGKENIISESGTGHSQDGYTGETLLKSEYKTELIAEGTLTLEDSTLEKDGVSVTVEEGFLGKERDIQIKRVTEDVSYSFDGEEVPLTVYEVDIDGIHDGSMITIDLPMDKKAAPEYGAGYIDDETGELKPALSTYDPDTGILTIHTTHLTKFCGIPIVNEKTKNAALGYVSGYDFIDSSEKIDYNTMINLLKTSLENDGNIECGMSVLDKISMVQGGASFLDGLAGAPAADGVVTGMDGAGHLIYKNSVGTVGEIFNTNYGKSGSLSLTPEFGKKPVHIEGYDSKLKTVYPSKVIEKIGDGLTWAGRFLSLLKVTKGVYEEGLHSKSAGSEALKWAAGEAITLYIKYGTYTAGLSVYMVGVGALGLAIDYVYSEALAGRKEVYVHAYTKYYAGEGHRTDDEWIAEFKKIMNNGGGQKEFDAAIDEYVNKFWKECDKISDSYLASVLTDDDRAAWGVATGAGLTPEIRKDISDNYKARLVTKRMPAIFQKLALQNEWELAEKYEAQVESLRKLWNQDITLSIDTMDGLSAPGSEDGDEEDEKCYYAGCTVRFKDIKGKVSDPKAWETVLNKEGKGSIKFKLFPHMLYNVGNEIEIVRTEGGKETVLLTDTFDFQEPYSSYYSYPRLSASYTIKEIPDEEEPGDFPRLSLEMEKSVSIGTKYDDHAKFELKPDGSFSISLPELHRTNTPWDSVNGIKFRANALDIGSHVYIGNMSNGLKVTVSGDETSLYSRDITTKDQFNYSNEMYYIYHEGDSDQRDEIERNNGTMKMVPQFYDYDTEISFSSITLTVKENESGSGGTLTILIRENMEVHVETYNEYWGTSETRDDIDPYWATFETAIDEKTLEEFRTCFPESN